MPAYVDQDRPYIVYGLTRSYFTRKMTGYLDFKRIPWTFRRQGTPTPEQHREGWPGAIPALRSPEGELMWDSTAMIHHLEQRFPEPSVLPPDPVQRFLCYAIEDVCDEWLYRPAVGTRWHFEENTAHGGWELARDLTVRAPLTCDQARDMVAAYVRSTCPPLGVTADNIHDWVAEVLRPWMRGLDACLRERPYLFGARPSLADFAVFGGCAAHFASDPVCRRWLECDAPALLDHTHRLLEPDDIDGPSVSAGARARSTGTPTDAENTPAHPRLTRTRLTRTPESAWADPDDLPAPLISLLADLGRHYLPWVTRATTDGAADLRFDSGRHVTIHTTDFLREARATLLARYATLRCDALDAALDRAGIRSFYADHLDQASSILDPTPPPRPALNRPFPPPA